GDEVALEQVEALERLAEQEARAPDDDVAPVADELLEQLLQRERARPAVDQRDVDDREVLLERRELVEAVQDHLCVLARAAFYADADAVPFALVADVARPPEPPPPHLLRDLL